jgi:hypothetical protein
MKIQLALLLLLFLGFLFLDVVSWMRLGKTIVPTNMILYCGFMLVAVTILNLKEKPKKEKEN